MTKTKRKPQIPVRSTRLVRRERRCQWLTELKGWNDCGAVATHVRPDCGLTYCAQHAAYFGRYCHLEPLPPNDRTQARRPLSNDKQQGDPGVA